ncbi:DUF6932 family protein [Marinoscillum luteum]|uniref:DUF6932 family protein n=1 Tax=Marinoscillum luteum TaxID=861051 RepID=A0ABW7N756_9BACT
MELNQKEYDLIADSIPNNAMPILNKEERLRFYYLHRTLQKNIEHSMNDHLCAIRKKKLSNPGFILSNEERLFIYDYLNQKRKSVRLNRYEYNQLAFLGTNLNVVNDFDIPKWPNIKTTTLEDIKVQLSMSSDQRKMLFQVLKEGIDLCIKKFKSDKLGFIIGGSYVDEQNIYPNDIDLIVILPIDAFQNNLYDNVRLKITDQFMVDDNKRGLFDLIIIPDNYSILQYMSFSRIILLSNTPMMRSEYNIKNQEYTFRDLLKINM